MKFTFDHRGETHEFAHPLSKINPGFLRRHRHRNELDLAFTILEEVAGDECLAVIDEMTTEEFAALTQSLKTALGASLGE